MRKVLALVLFVGCFVGIASADSNILKSAAYTVSQTTSTTLPCLLKYVAYTSTGTANTITLRNGTTDVMVTRVSATAGTYSFDFSACPVKFTSNLNWSTAASDSGAYINLIFERVPGK